MRSWDRGDTLTIPEDAIRAVLHASRAKVTVVDLPRHLTPAAHVVLAECTAALLIVPAEVRATAAAARVALSAAASARDLSVVVRGPAPSRLPAPVIADALGLPLAGQLAPEPGIAAALERGQAPA